MFIVMCTIGVLIILMYNKNKGIFPSLNTSGGAAVGGGGINFKTNIKICSLPLQLQTFEKKIVIKTHRVY